MARPVRQAVPSRAKAAIVARAYHPAPLIADEAALADAVAAVLARDAATIGHLVEVGGPPPLRRREPGFAGLVATIVAQQVSTASANAITGRLIAAFNPLTPAAIVAASDEALRACGLSNAKMRTLRALGTAILSGALDLDALDAVAPEAAHAALVAVKGIGPWTADIFLLFCLGHPDAWPSGDLALQEAARIALRLEARPDLRALDALAERWRPHRGVVARMLWAYYRAVKRGRESLAIGEPPGAE